MITHPEKVLFPDDGITKGELAVYYEEVAPLMLPHLGGRPVTMERYPSGIGEKGFIQKDVSRGYPEWLQRVEVPKKGGTVHHAIVSDLRSLLWVVNQNTITPHVWTSRLPNLREADLCVFDLDPAGDDDPDALRNAAVALRDLLQEHGRESWVKTSGSKGFHIMIPVAPGTRKGEAARFADRVARQLVERHPDALTQEFNKKDRAGRIYVDTGRNGYSATFAAAYAVRPRAGAPVSAPCTWDEVASGAAIPRSFTLRNMVDRIAHVGDVWKDLPSRLPRNVW